MEGHNSKHQDKHGTVGMTSWIHKHRKLAKWLARVAVVGVTAFSYYLKKQEKKIEEEERKER